MLATGIHEPFSSRNYRKRNALKNSIFEIYRKLYHQKALEEKSIFKLKATQTILGILWSFQIISCLSIPNLSIKHWEEHAIMWKIIGYFRLDNICSEFGAINECLYISLSITFLLGASIICLAISIYFSISNSRLYSIYRWAFNFWIYIVLIPSVALYTIFLKYSIWPQKYISEYKNNNHIEDFKINAGLQFAIILALVIDFPLLYFYTQFSSEIRHSKSSKTIKAKAHSKIDSHIAIFTYFSPMFYALLCENYIIYLQLFFMIFSIILVIEAEIYLPYFSLYGNLIQIFQLFTVALTSFGFVLGYLMDNWLVIIFIVIFLGPLSALFVLQFTIKLQISINAEFSKNTKEISSKYDLEKRLRYQLCLNDTDHKKEIIRIFEKFFIKNSSQRDKLQIIWVANYCLFTLKDEHLAKVKLSKTKAIKSWNLEAEFQEYLCNKNINESPSNESLKFLNYFQQLNRIKKKDSKLCVYLLKFWEDLTSSKPNLKRLINRLEWIDKNISFLGDQYKQLTLEFLDSRECLALYASYTRDIIYDYEKSNLLEIKLKGLNSQYLTNTNLKSISFLNDFRGILIISAESKSFGSILFSNPKAAEIMKTSIGNLEESNIMNFIHHYYWHSIKEEIQRIIHYGSNSEIDLSKGFFLNTPQKYLIECTGKAIITSIDNNLALILNFELKKANYETALLTEAGEIACCSENFDKFSGKYNENLVGYNIKDLFSEAEIYKSALIFYLESKETILVMSYIYISKLKVFYAMLISHHEEIQKWKNKNYEYNNEEREINDKYLLSPDCYNKGFYKTWNLLNKKYINSENELIPQNPSEPSETFEKNSLSKSSDAKSQIPSQKKFFAMLATSSRSINILHFAFILSVIPIQVIAVLTTNIIVLFYAFSYIDFIKNMDFPMALAKAESRLQIASYNAQLLWEITSFEAPAWYQDLIIAWDELPGCIDALRDIYMYIASNLPKWNYCSSKTILTDKHISVWDSGNIKKASLLDLLSQSTQLGYSIISKYNISDYTYEVRFLKMNGYGYGFQYINRSLYEVMDCQRLLMHDFKSEVFILLILGIGVLGLCFCAMIPFCYSVIKIENDFWYNLRKKAFQNYSEMKQTLLERLKSVHDNSEIHSSNRNPSKKIFNFKNYWKYIWRICIYFIVVAAFSLINITYLYENCINYLAYRPEVLREIIRTKIFLNTLAISGSDIQDNIAGVPLNYLVDLHTYANSSKIFQDSMIALRDSRLILRNPKYSPILSSNFKKLYYENDSQLHTHYLDYGAYADETELINGGYVIANLNITNDDWRKWYYNLTLFRNNYDKYADDVDNYSQSVIDDQVKIIVEAFSVFVLASIMIYFILFFIFFKKEKKYLQKINAMMNIMPV